MDGLALRCMQCELCRRYRAKVWAHRIMLEATQHENNAFVTLTYDDEHLPADGSVNPETTQLWLKRFRKAVSPLRIRYYLVGEYGEKTMRPHYHAVIFGYPTCSRGQTDLKRKNCCTSCDTVKRTWQQGAVQVARVEPASASYVAGYVQSKIRRRALGTRAPEFQRCSTRPGLGLWAMHDVADVLLRYDLDEKLEDVPPTLQHGERRYPLGRYLRGKLREMIGRPDATPESVLEALKSELSEVREAAFENSQSFASLVLGETLQKRRNALAKRTVKRDTL